MIQLNNRDKHLKVEQNIITANFPPKTVLLSLTNACLCSLCLGNMHPCITSYSSFDEITQNPQKKGKLFEGIGDLLCYCFAAVLNFPHKHEKHTRSALSGRAHYCLHAQQPVAGFMNHRVSLSQTLER